MRAHNEFAVSFYLRQNKSKAQDYGIYCCIKVTQSNPRELCIQNGVSEDDWDSDKGCPKPKTKELQKLALLLETIKSRLLNIYLDLKLNGSDVSAEIIKNIYLGKVEINYTILQLTDMAIEKYKRELEKGSLKNYHATRSYLVDFCRVKYKAGDISLKSLTYSFIEGFKTFILSTPRKATDPCHNNGCMKHLARLKKIITWGYEMRFLDRDVFASFRIVIKRHESEVLRWTELKKLEEITLNKPMLNLVRDLFVFCCYTGMAPVDMQGLRPRQIYSNQDNITWITYTRAKSSVSAHVPLLKVPLSILEKYKLKKCDLPRETVFPFVTNKTLNDSLKIIGEVCGLSLPLNFYMARHTFATTVTLLQGVPLTSIKVMMGHQKIESTMIYTRASNPIVGVDMMIAQNKML